MEDFLCLARVIGLVVELTAGVGGKKRYTKAHLISGRQRVDEMDGADLQRQAAAASLSEKVLSSTAVK